MAVQYPQGEGLLEAGQVQLLKGAAVISNPYEHELANYLQLIFSDTNEEPALYSFHLQNKLTDLFVASMQHGLLFASIGKFKGREKLVELPA
ncbi:hypothetical protein AAHN97_22255 [Chitinophaga niabensis]|uniref:hypothetical protein n=1 Tax=Chitinophaga niabensis TaxID=536979 RepID=UPI0031BA50B3